MEINAKGFTLLETIVVIAILGVIAGIAALSVNGLIEKSKREVCHVNVVNVERLYESHLNFKAIEHSEAYFTQFILDLGNEICPDRGHISYVDEVVNCSLHPKDNEVKDSNDKVEDVPFL